MLTATARAVQDHYPLVRRLAHAMARRLPRTIDVEDLVGAGAVGLVQAAMRFDPARSHFEHYAEIRIRGAIRDYLRGMDWMTRTHRRRARVVDQATRGLERTLGHAPGDHEVAERLGWSRELVAWSRLPLRLMSVEQGVLDEQAAPDGHPALHVEQQEQLRRLRAVLPRLTRREREVLTLYYVEDMTLRAIGERFGVTESRVCQVHRAALARLRAALDGPAPAAAAA